MDALNPILTDAQLKAELKKCEFCEEKPCRDACPANCSPADFIMAARLGADYDIQRSAAAIMTSNPLGGVCGVVCPDKFCQKACVHKNFTKPVEIPAVQATVVEFAKKAGVMPKMAAPVANGKKVAVIGAGPAGLGAAAMLGRLGYGVTVFEKETKAGGACYLIPEHRLSRDILDSDIQWLFNASGIQFKPGTTVDNPESLLSSGFDGVVVAAGLQVPYALGIPGEGAAIKSLDYLRNPAATNVAGKNVLVVGGGAIATDCAVTAALQGAASVEMVCLERQDEMPLTAKERNELIQYGISVTGRTRLTSIDASGVKTIKVQLAPGAAFSLKGLSDVAGSEAAVPGVNVVITAIGSRSGMAKVNNARVFYAGDCEHGPSTVVEAVAGGKNVAVALDASLNNRKAAEPPRPRKSVHSVPGYNTLPVDISVDFFGRKLISPFILSAAPPSDGYEQMKKAYKAGWAGGVMKTSFDNVPIHIPGEYMFAIDEHTYGNCDNVSGHPLDRVCAEIKALVKEYPDRLTAASTGGPVTGDDAHDKAAWQSNTRKLEAAGVMAIEYSLSCPQGGDGTEGDIVSQNPRLTAKIIDWILEVSNPEIPKLFKLTGAVTSIPVIVNAVKETMDKYPNKKAGITLANTFPSLAFRNGNKAEWLEGIVVGLSGKGITNISNLSICSAVPSGVYISGNGGPMDHLAAANFLALGARNVQFCTTVMKNGYGVVEHLHSGLSHLLQSRGLKSVEELIGVAQPGPVTGFMDLTPVKKISNPDHDKCQSCGNCTRCSYLAIKLNDDKKPVVDAAKCIGCSICTQKCFASALNMRVRTAEELAVLKED